VNNSAAIVFGVTPFLLAAEDGKPILAWEPCLTLLTEVSMLPGTFPINMWEAYSCPTSVPNLCLFVVAYLLTIPPSLLCSQVIKKHITGKLTIMTPSLIQIQSREREISVTNKQMLVKVLLNALL